MLSKAPVLVQAAVALALKPQECRAGETIFKAGDIGRDVYFLHEGRVKIKSSELHGKTRGLTAGDVFGTATLTSFSGVRRVTATAVTYCDLYLISRRAIEDICTEHPEEKSNNGLWCTMCNVNHLSSRKKSLTKHSLGGHSLGKFSFRRGDSFTSSNRDLLVHHKGEATAINGTKPSGLGVMSHSGAESTHLQIRSALNSLSPKLVSRPSMQVIPVEKVEEGCQEEEVEEGEAVEKHVKTSSFEDGKGGGGGAQRLRIERVRKEGEGEEVTGLGKEEEKGEGTSTRGSSDESIQIGLQFSRGNDGSSHELNEGSK